MNIVVNGEHHSCHICVNIICFVWTPFHWAFEDGHVDRNNINKMLFIHNDFSMIQNVVSNLK